jgi:hypothetical protein
VVTVDGDCAERPEVYLQRAIGHPVPGIAVPPATDSDGDGVLARELHAASHVVDVRGAYHRERAAIIGKIPDLPRLVVTRRAPAQQPPTNAAGEIIEVGNRIGGGEPEQRTRVGERTQSHGTPSGAHEIAAGPSGAISFAHAHRLVLGQECLLPNGPAARFGAGAHHRAIKSAGRVVQE